jgi:hypothetical protein
MTVAGGLSRGGQSTDGRKINSSKRRNLPVDAMPADAGDRSIDRARHRAILIITSLGTCEQVRACSLLGGGKFRLSWSRRQRKPTAV